MKYKDSIGNIFYDQYLSDHALGFLENVKSNEYNNFDNPFVVIINKSEYFQNLIINNTTELGNTEKRELETELLKDNTQVQQLQKIYENRRSTRKYDESGLSFGELSALLKLSYYNVGENKLVDKEGNMVKRLHPRRNIASGGGLYPVDMFIINLKTQDLDKGVYYYNVDKECVETISLFDDDKEVFDAFFTKYRSDVEYDKISGFVIFVGNLNRVAFKYRDRGVLFTMIDVGALMHSLYLASSTLGIGCCGIGGYFEDDLHRILKLKTNQQMVLGTIVFGKI